MLDFYQSGKLTSIFNLVTSRVLGAKSLDNLYLFIASYKEQTSYQTELDLI